MSHFALPTEGEIPSPAELLLDLLERFVPSDEVPGGIVAGPLDHEQQQAGAVNIALAGRPRVDDTELILWSRLQIRCVGPTLDVIDRIAFVVDVVVQRISREPASQADGHTYLVHRINPVAGPSWHRDSNMTWEGLLFVEMASSLQALA